MKKLLLSFFSIGTLILSAQEFDQNKMDKFFASIETNRKGMGSISIFKNGTEEYQKSFGLMDVSQNIKANGSTKYRIGSISKTFTAVIVMQLYEENSLALDGKLSEFYPQVRNAEKITIENLLRHQSGIFNFTNLPNYRNWMEKPLSRAEIIDKISGFDSLFEPGTKSEYSNSNYMLLTLIIEKIEGRSFSDVLNDRISTKLELGDTYYGGEIRSDKNEAQSYMLHKKWKKSTESDMSIPMGAGAIVSTAADLNLFFSALFGNELVSEKSLNEMTILKDRFGLGLFQVPFYDKRAFGHNGGIDGFQSNAYFFPKEGVSIAYTGNAVVMPVNDIMIGALSIYFNKPYNLPEFLPPFKVKKKDMESYLGVYSGPTFPLKISITNDELIMIAQATGQPSFALEAFELHKFKYDPASLKLEFVPEEDVMILRQAGAEFRMTKE